MTIEAVVPHHTADEARQHESAFLENLAGAQDHYEWIVERRAWTDLGFDTFAGWWEGRIQPVMRALSMRPTREIAAKVIEQVRTEEAELPPAQRHTQKQLGEMVGLDRRTASGWKPPQDRPQVQDAHRPDLGEPRQDGAAEKTPPKPAVRQPESREPDPPDEEGADADLDAQLDAEMEHTAARFRSNFSRAIATADDVWQFDLDRIAELYAATYERDLQPFLDEMTAWCARVGAACKRRRSGLRLVSGGDR